MADNAIQKFLKGILPKEWAEDMEASSKRWMIQCQNCKFERSVWELGGIRWKAAGTPRQFRYCAKCGTKSWHLIYHKNK